MRTANLVTFGRGVKRLPRTPQPPLPPFDASDSFGDVHTVLPPESTIGTDLEAIKADFNGVTIAAKWGTPPFLVGANSTPLTMLMTPMAPLYPTHFQDAIFTEHASRYTHFIVAPDGWNHAENGFAFTPQTYVSWCQRVRSWGFRVVHWQGDPNPDHPCLLAALSAGVLSDIIFGEEVDGKITSEQYDAALRVLVNRTPLPIFAHFTPNYPEGFPRDTFLTNWADFDGRVHLAWQAGAYGGGPTGHPPTDSAGKMSAMLYYARRRVALGEVGGDGRQALRSKVIAFETMASDQLYGHCDEAYGNLRTWELLCATRNDDRIPAVAGFGNGARYPDGSPI